MNITDRITKLVLARKPDVGPRGVKRAIANACGISYEAVRQWYAGDTGNIKNENLVAVAEKFDTTVDWLLSGEGEPPRRGLAEPASPEQATAAEIEDPRKRMDRIMEQSREIFNRFMKTSSEHFCRQLSGPDGIQSVKHYSAFMLLLTVVEASRKEELDERDFRVLCDTLQSLKAHKATQDDPSITPIPESLQGLAEAALDAAENGDPSDDMLGMLQNGIRKQQPKDKARPDVDRKKRST